MGTIGNIRLNLFEMNEKIRVRIIPIFFFFSLISYANKSEVINWIIISLLKNRSIT